MWLVKTEIIPVVVSLHRIPRSPSGRSHEMLAAPGDSGPSGCEGDWVVVGALGVNKKGSEKLVREIP